MAKFNRILNEYSASNDISVTTSLAQIASFDTKGKSEIAIKIDLVAGDLQEIEVGENVTEGGSYIKLHGSDGSTNDFAQENVEVLSCRPADPTSIAVGASAVIKLRFFLSSDIIVKARGTSGTLVKISALTS